MLSEVEASLHFRAFWIFHYVQNDTDAQLVMPGKAKHLYISARLVMLSEVEASFPLRTFQDFSLRSK